MKRLNHNSFSNKSLNKDSNIEDFQNLLDFKNDEDSEAYIQYRNKMNEKYSYFTKNVNIYSYFHKSLPILLSE